MNILNFIYFKNKRCLIVESKNLGSGKGMNIFICCTNWYKLSGGQLVWYKKLKNVHPFGSATWFLRMHSKKIITRVWQRFIYKAV